MPLQTPPQVMGMVAPSRYIKRLTTRCKWMSFRTQFALSSTIAYLCLFVIMICIRKVELFALPLNELGDFLAGAFGPLALAWLVFGYFQQGDELKQGTDALLMQARELKSSVEQQSAIADSQKSSLENHDRSLEPLLKLTHDGSKMIEGDYYDSFSLRNLGSYCECVEVHRVVSDEQGRHFSLQPLFNGDSIGFLLDLEEVDAELVVRYKRINGSKGAQAFEVKHVWDDGPEIRIIKKSFVS